MLADPERGATGTGDLGFTLIELAIVGLLVSLMSVMAAASLLSLQKTTARNDTTIADEQSVSAVMLQMERDIRSAAAIVFPSTGSPGDNLELAPAASGQSAVLWTYNPSTSTLIRQVQNGSTWQAPGYTITNVSNGTSTPIFTYYNSQAKNISSSSTSNIAACATGIAIQIDVTPVGAGLTSFQENAEVALTNQLNTVTTPGNQTCGTSS